MSYRKLPIGIQSFENIRRGNYIYIDKTLYIWNLVRKGKVYFLSRPRRFGKSLFVSTMEAYFQGKKELFDGLAISELEEGRGKDAWQKYPVFTFYLSSGEYYTESGLKNRLAQILSETEEAYGITPDGSDLSTRFISDIRKLYEKTGRQVVVLVDEYDKPLLAAGDSAQEEKNRMLYKSFFSALKDQDRYIKFAFFTGVTKFSKISISSDLNQLKDISLLQEYAAVCGITKQELVSGFGPEIEEMASSFGISTQDCLDELRNMYDGYHFSEDVEGVYNPYSLINALSDRRFDTYWFESGTPSVLIQKLKNSSLRPEQFVDGIESTEKELKDYRTDNENPVPLFYQSGYLTITGYDRRFRTYSLSFPNKEVRDSFFESLVPYVLGEKDSEHPLSAKKMVSALERGDTDALHDQLYAVFASIPYMETDISKYEPAWRNQIYLIFMLLGQFVACEPHTSRGRADCVIETDDYIYIFEFKVDKSADEALGQIERNDYAGKYRADRRKLFKIGVNFSSEKRNIAEWEVRINQNNSN